MDPRKRMNLYDDTMRTRASSPEQGFVWSTTRWNFGGERATITEGQRKKAGRMKGGMDTHMDRFVEEHTRGKRKSHVDGVAWHSMFF